MPENHQHMKLLLHAIEGINRTAELKQLLLKCMESVCTVIKSEASSLMLLDKATGRLHLSIPTGPVKDQIKGMVIPRNKGVAGWVLKNKKPYLVNDMSESEEFYGDISEDFTTRNMICVPMFDSNNEAVGIMQALNKKGGKDFNEKDIETLNTLAGHASLSIEKVQEVDTLKNEINEKDERLKELHKGFENNLNALSAFVQLQGKMLSDASVEFMMKSTGARIEAIAQAHEVLFKTDSEQEVDLGFYLSHLTESISNIFEDFPKDIRYSFDIDKVHLKTDEALTVGLIVTEVILNMFREAFTGMDKGVISIAIKKDEGDKVLVSVSDNGIGLSAFLDSTVDENLASVIIKKLASSLKANSQQIRNIDGGTTFTIFFARQVDTKYSLTL